MKNLLLLGCLLAAAPVVAQTKIKTKTKVKTTASKGPAVSAATVARVVRTLAADDMQGRGTGQPGGDAKAAAFLAGEFARIGLQPLPGLRGFEQVFRVYQTQPGPLSVTLNGRVLAPGQAVAMSGQPTLTWTSEDAQSPVVVVVGPDPTERQKLNALTHPTANTLVFVDTAHAKQFGYLANYLGHGTTSAEPPSPYSAVFVLAVAPAAIKYRISSTAAVRPVELRNVVGLLPGHAAQRSTENVVFSGHYDHLGTVKPVAGDSIANGADDDASGTTAVVALA